MLKQFPPPRDYMALTLRDLLEARDVYHVHLAHLSNVVGTAVGRYLIREDDWYATHSPSEPKDPNWPPVLGPRTLFNTVIKDWSWPCVLVFVNDWKDKSEFKASPDQMVPRALFLPDGRVVPTCVVFAEHGAAAEPNATDLSFPSSLVGGGYAAVTDVQRTQRLGSFGCLVTDGSLTYALTNRHVAGDPGREIFTMLRDEKTRVGVSAEKQIDCRRFTDMYPGWAGSNVELRLDAGLVVVDNVNKWTAQVVGMGALDELMDLTRDSLTLGFVDSPVTAFGAASGELEGRVAALFYRYRSVGGVDYATEFLIRPAAMDGQGTVHGDSGTLWFWREPGRADGTPERLRPFAMQWGGHVLVDTAGSSIRSGRFALASSLSTICREMNVTLVRDVNTGLPEYWGDVGHYTIALFACDRVSGNLQTLMHANRERVAYPEASITSKTGIKKRGANGFVPLADVPDRIWKVPNATGFRGNNENGNHFADMDQKLPDTPNKGKTLLELCLADSTRVTPAFWLDYYTRVKDSSKGILPFRVWQFFNEMQAAATSKDTTRFVAAAGLMAHYVGDACQPLHISFMFNGEPVIGPNGKKMKRGEGVHSAFESDMLSDHSVEFLAKLTTSLSAGGPAPVPTTGRDAAVAIVALMGRTFATLKPLQIVNAFDSGLDLWPKFKTETVKVIADGVRTLAAIWQGAWQAGNGSAVPASKLVTATTDALIALYSDTTFVQSLRIGDIGKALGIK